MSAAAELIEQLSAEQDADALQAALDAYASALLVSNAQRMGSWSVARLAEYAKSRHARVILSFDPNLPNNARIELEPLSVPLFLAHKVTE